MSEKTRSEPIRWTEKIQAFAAIIAIFGGIAGFIKLFSTDKDMQNQISNLASIAKDFSIQTTMMREEVEILKRRNTILLEQLNIDKEKWILQNMPDFDLDLSDWDSWSGHNDSLTIEGFILKNSGGAAHIIDMKPNRNNTCNVKVPLTYVSAQGKVKFNLSVCDKKDVFLDASIIFKDFDGMVYSQRFVSDKISFNTLLNRSASGLMLLNIKHRQPNIIKK